MPDDLRTMMRLRDTPGAPVRFLVEAAYVHLFAGEPGTAGQVFEAVRLLDPEEPIGFVGAAEAALAASRPRDAERLLARALRIPSIDRETASFATVLTGDAAMMRERTAQAVAAWEEARRIGTGCDSGVLAGKRLDDWRAIATRPAGTNPA